MQTNQKWLVTQIPINLLVKSVMQLIEVVRTKQPQYKQKTRYGEQWQSQKSA